LSFLARPQYQRAWRCLSLLLLVCLTACVSAPRSPAVFTQKNPTVHYSGFEDLSLTLPLRAFLRSPSGAQRSAWSEPVQLTIYIEGDGAAWQNRFTPPQDPTPFDPLAAQLANQDPSAWLAYLGRPCQYLDADALAHCDPSLWREARFGSQALALSDEAVTRVRAAVVARWQIQHAQQLQGVKPLPEPKVHIRLIGYSGGGALAALLASGRADITCLITVAAPLDTKVWTDLQILSPLRSSLNPATPSPRLASITQTHWFGAKDRVVPPTSIGDYAKHNLGPQGEVWVVDGYDHRLTWVESWPRLLAKSCRTDSAAR
jgi:hypothetical protein